MRATEFVDTSRLNHGLLQPHAAHSRPITIEIANARQSASRPHPAGFTWNAASIPVSSISSNSARRAPSEPGYRLSFSMASIVVLGSAICLWLLLFFLIFMLYFNVSSTWSAYKEELRPHVHELANHLANVLRNVDSATNSANHMLVEADSLEHSVVPALAHAVNDSASVIHKMEEISRNPVLRLSLGTN